MTDRAVRLMTLWFFFEGWKYWHSKIVARNMNLYSSSFFFTPSPEHIKFNGMTFRLKNSIGILTDWKKGGNKLFGEAINIFLRVELWFRALPFPLAHEILISIFLPFLAEARTRPFWKTLKINYLLMHKQIFSSSCALKRHKRDSFIFLARVEILSH